MYPPKCYSPRDQQPRWNTYPGLTLCVYPVVTSCRAQWLLLSYIKIETCHWCFISPLYTINGLLVISQIVDGRYPPSISPSLNHWWWISALLRQYSHKYQLKIHGQCPMEYPFSTICNSINCHLIQCPVHSPWNIMENPHSTTCNPMKSQ